jgi:putative transposase
VVLLSLPGAAQGRLRVHVPVLSLAVLMFGGDLAKDAELLVLRHENSVLRRHVGRVRYEPADRVWLAALARLVPRRRWAEVFSVTPATLLAWHRRLAAGKYDMSRRRKPGRPPTSPGVARLAVRLAREDPLWGHRAAEAHVRAGVHRARYPLDAPGRRHSAPNRRVDRAAGRNLALALGGRFEDIRFLIRDRGSNFTASFDAVFRAAGTRILRTAVQAPRMNAICERLVGTLRRELLDRVLIPGEGHLRAVLAEYQVHYNTARPHQGIAQRVPDGGGHDDGHLTVADLDRERILRNPSWVA